MRTLQRERSLVKSLVDLGLKTEQAIELLMHPVDSTSPQSNSSMTRRSGAAETFAAQAQMGEDDAAAEEKKTFSFSPKIAEYLDGLVDASDRQEGGGVILYWNDLATDARYVRSDPSLQAVRIAFPLLICTSDLERDHSQLIRISGIPLFSPMLRIRQNLVNVIFVLDLSQMRSLSLLNSLSEHFVARGFPVRWGFVPEGDGDSKSVDALHKALCLLFTRPSDGSTGILHQPKVWT